MTIDETLKKNADVFKEVRQRILGGEDISDIVIDYLELAEKLEIGAMGMAYYVLEYAGENYNSRLR